MSGSVLKYCRVCLVTDVKMYNLDMLSNNSIGSILFNIAQIQILDRNQYVCFECASLLQKYQHFKTKCIKAHNILSSMTVNTSEVTKQLLNNIDRKHNKLESNLIFSNKIYYETSNDLSNEESKYNTILITGNGKQMQDESIDIKTEDITENRQTDNLTSLVSGKDHMGEENIVSKESPKKKIKSKSKNEIQLIDETPENYSDNNGDFIESTEETEFTEIPSPNTTPLRTNIKKHIPKRTKLRKRKIKTESASDDNLSDNEPLSKCATKTLRIVKEPLCKKNGLNIEFFDEYATVTFLTHEDARKELLTRKESSNYKRSPFKCSFCYKGYEAKAAYENHMKKHSLEYGDYVCDLCYLRFPKPIYLCKHKLSCHKRKFSCKLCPYICYCMYQARTHVSLHKGKKYPCKDCGEEFSMPNSLLMHKRVKHLNESVPESVCEICGNTFGSPRGLFLHNMKLHRMDKNTKEGPKCEECGVHFTSEVAWKRHLVLSTKHTVSNGCKYCGERFSDSEELKSHIRTNHPRVKTKNKKMPAACTICNKWLTSDIEYNNHMITEHPHSDEAKKPNINEQSSFVCEVCGQTFKQQCFLTYHQRKHTGERPYKCGECGKTFQMSGALAIHRTVHKRHRQHKCHLCARLFSFKSALNKHMKVHLGIRPHKCTICDKGFIHMCDLKLHIKYVHDKVPWPKKKSKRNITDDNVAYLDYN